MTTIILIIAALTILFGIIELFFMPGFGIAGIASIVCAIIDTILVYKTFGLAWAIVVVAISVLLLIFILRWVAKSRTFERMALHASIDSTSATKAQMSVKIGDTGLSLTRLALIGNAEIDGKNVEVKSSGEFIPPHTPIRVISVNEANITVERIHK